MKRNYILAFVLVLFFTNQLYSQEPLPKGLTEDEKKDYFEFINNPGFSKLSSPPATPPRTPAEWEEAQGIIITWGGFSSELREIVKRAKEAAMVYIICDNPTQVQNYLVNGGLNMQNIELLTLPFNSIWVRDFGPQSVYLDNGDLAIVDWLYNRPHRPEDNEIPFNLANEFGLPYYLMSGSNGDLIATGGNFMTDGHGTGFSSKLILAENPSYNETQINQIKYQYMGIDRYIKMEELPYDNISHIDMHMKLLDEETILVGKFPTNVSDGPFIEDNVNYVFNNFLTAFGRKYRFIQIPMVPSASGQYPPASHYRTFTNSIIINNIILVPQYGHNLDATGLQVYRDAMPGYEVYGINMENIIPLSGAIHCITREIAASDPIHISHPIRRHALVEDDEIEFKAAITSPSGITEAKLFWSLDVGAGFDSVEMTLEADTFYANIPGQELETLIHYYISATNSNDKTISKPFVAPDGYYTFEVKSEYEDWDNPYSLVEIIKPTFKIFPNPATDQINLSISPNFSGGNIVVYNIQGNMVYNAGLGHEFNSTEIKKQIPVSDLPAGVYFVKVYNKDLIEVAKFIKK